MVGNESARSQQSVERQPDRLQQCLNRLLKHFEDLSYEDRKQAVREALRRMEFSDDDRREILRRME
jgi:hypothetical protein